MIIFDLETLADDSHRRHFIQEPPYWIPNPDFIKDPLQCSVRPNPEWKTFVPDWQSYHEACDKDDPIDKTIEVFKSLSCKFAEKTNVQIWTGRCESTKEKTIDWLNQYIYNYFDLKEFQKKLKMRPIGDERPAHVIKEEWLNDLIEKHCEVFGSAPI